ncbi:MAG: hypothetical protein M0007_06925 [Actinomycetota bacterium]|nr:hypothetical protein [Actinomycetota bacterium]
MKDARPVAGSTNPWTLEGPARPSAPSRAATPPDTSLLSNVSPRTEIPAFVSSRHRGTAPSRVTPSAAISASAVNSLPPRRCWMRGSGTERVAAGRSAGSSTGTMWRDPRPKRGFTNHGPGNGGSAPGVIALPGTVGGTGMPAASAARWNCHLSMQVRTASGVGTQVAIPDAASRSAPSPRATISSATVAITAVAPVVVPSSHSASRKPRSPARGRTPEASASRSPAASGEASAATVRWPDRRRWSSTEIPAGPPAPVTSTTWRPISAPAGRAGVGGPPLSFTAPQCTSRDPPGVRAARRCRATAAGGGAAGARRPAPGAPGGDRPVRTGDDVC